MLDLEKQPDQNSSEGKSQKQGEWFAFLVTVIVFVKTLHSRKVLGVIMSVNIYREPVNVRPFVCDNRFVWAKIYVL